MSGNTPRYGIPYPTNNDAVDVPGDMQNLAEYLDTTVLPSLVTGDNVIPITVDAGVVVNAGDPFYIVGETTLATVPPKFAWKVERSLSTDPTTLPAVGIANENVLADALSYGTIVGPVDAELDTGSFPLGTVLYVGNSTALTGYNLTSTPPSPTEQLQRVAVVTKSDNSNGSITFIPSDVPRVRLDVDQNWGNTQTFLENIIVPDRPEFDSESNAANTRFVENELARYGALEGINVWGQNNAFLGDVQVPILAVGDRSTNAVNAVFVYNELQDNLQYYSRLDGATFSGQVVLNSGAIINENLNVEAITVFNDDVNVNGSMVCKNLTVEETISAPGLSIGHQFFSTTNTTVNSSSSPVSTDLEISYIPKSSSSYIYIQVNVSEVTKIGNSTGASLFLSLNGESTQKFANNAGNNGLSSDNNVGTVSTTAIYSNTDITPKTFTVTLSNSSNNQGSVSIGGNSVVSSISVVEYKA